MTRKTLGIIGGGQLGMFICIAAKKINLNTIVFSENSEFSAKKFCDNYVIGSITNNEKISEFINSSDFFTIETENISKKFLRLIQSKKKLFPSCEIIEITQNRLKEKKFLNSLNDIKTAKYFEINNFKDLENYTNEMNFNCILKTQEFGYDGKGQFTINKNNLSKFKDKILKNYILEEKINFKLEISVIVIRSSSKMIVYPPVQNIHRDSILRETIFPAEISEKLKLRAIEKAIYISENLDLNGVLAIEMFLTSSNEILINELAPRPHNSGHWTIDACKFSQFDNLVSLIKHNIINEPEPFRKCKMVNIIGEDYVSFKKIEKKYNAYDYFKKDIRLLRKMGHYVLFE